MTRLAFSLVIVLALVPAGAARSAEEFDPKARAEAIAPYLDPQAAAVGHIDLGRINVGEILKEITRVYGTEQEPVGTPPQLVKAEERIKKTVSNLSKAGANEIYAVFGLTDFSRPRPFLIVPVKKGGNPRAVAGILFSGRPDGPTSLDEAERLEGRRRGSFEVCTTLDGVVFCGSKKQLARIKELKAKPRPELAKAFEAAGDTAAQLVLVPTDEMRRVVREMMPDLPQEFGGASAETLARGVQWMAVGIDAPPKMSLRVVVQSKDAESARAVRRVIVAGLEQVARIPEVRKELANVDEIINVLTPEVEDDRLVVSFDEKSDGAAKLVRLLSPPVHQAREAARRSQCRDKLKQFGLAMHNFHDVYSSFPPHASYDGDKKLLSWRVYLLPYLGGLELYKEFHLDEPWDSPHNRKLITKMPQVFACPDTPGLAKEGKTVYVAPIGPKMVMTGGKEGVQIRDITDGTSNTILLAEVAPEDAVIWTKPDDLEVDLDKIAPWESAHEGGFHALLCDGSVHFISKMVDPKTLRALFTRNGGEVVGEF